MSPQITSSLATARRLANTKTDTTAVPPFPPSFLTKPTSAYPPISSIPRTSSARLAQSAVPSHIPDPLYTPPTPADPNELPPSSPSSKSTPPKPPTVLYLAYGSNMAAKTFLGNRGIRPLSRVNVSAPSLRLTFDLPGTPFAEPCFANTGLRKIPKIPNKPPKIPDIPDIPSPPFEVNQHGDPVWDAGLIGVVYEVTVADWAHIVATEGAGVAYQDVLVPCIALPPSVRVPEKPPVPELPKPFLVHTLLAPTTMPGEKQSEAVVKSITNHFCPLSAKHTDDGDGTPPPKIPKWLLPLISPITRPDPEYAQPSARYLNLLITGAAEHDLPQNYQIWLQALHSYKRTTFWQTLGLLAISILWLPWIGIVFSLSGVIADDKGRVPLWMAALMGGVFRGVWWSYDVALNPLFGDGERTSENGGDGSMKKGRSREAAITLDEKRALLAA